jgi:HNH endonuclease
MTINEILRQRVRKRDGSRCEYCHSPEKISSIRILDHPYPRSLGGLDEFENLALACSRCNQRRYNSVTGRDIETATIAPLFNPREHDWSENFRWSVDGTRMVGTSQVGRATCDRDNHSIVQLGPKGGRF